MESNLFTVIICCYNGESRIASVLDKIYDQKNLEKYVYEIIVVDNHSTDSTKQVIMRYTDEEARIPLRYIYEDKCGLSNARRAGVEACHSEWIVFFDDDNHIQKNWFEEMWRYISVNNRIGIVNGGVVPEISFNMTKDELLRLKVSLKVLACTHFNEEELIDHPVTPFRNPIGAGMVIRCAPLKKLLENGWLSSPGRTKGELTSGEDGEMAFYVKDQGYDFGFCSKAILYHEISRVRLQDDYLKKIWFEIGRGVALVIKKQRMHTIKSIGYNIILEIRRRRFIRDKENMYKERYYSEYIRGYKYEWKN